jgi:Tol biopolymer transport system component
MKRKCLICFVITLVLLLLIPFSSGCTNTSTSPGKIAFVSDRDSVPQIYVMNHDGSNQTIIGSWCGYDDTFCWSPDGTKIAFIDGDGWLCLAQADGRNLSKLAEIPSYSICWSPDGEKVAVGCLDYDIYTLDAGTGELQNLTNTPDIIENLPSWSPESEKIAFVVYDSPYCEITLMDADGRNQTQITSERGICEELAWLPGGEKISYIWYSEEETGPEGICYDICLVDIKDGSKVNLTDSPKFDDRDLSWSPDGTKIAFSSRRQVIDTQIYVMDADGSQVRKLTTGDNSNYSPSWSPDSRKIVFTSSGPHPVEGDICIMDADGSNVSNLTNTPDVDDYLPTWSSQ